MENGGDFKDNKFALQYHHRDIIDFQLGIQLCNSRTKVRASSSLQKFQFSSKISLEQFWRLLYF